jgi:putative heme-binding domain-containing protein
VEKRGRAIGPDLTHLGGFTPEQILTAIREPSKDIAPAFLYWHVKMKDGTEGAGVDIFKNDTARFFLIDPTGKVTAYRHDQVAERTAFPVSMMPPGLLDRFSASEVADLLAFLQQGRE